MRSERQRSCVTVSIVLVAAVFMATGQVFGGEDRGEEYFQNAQRYFFGRGVPQSDIEAAKWARKAAEQGHAWGQNNLGWAYATGRGVPQNDAEAVKWFRKAAEQGYAAGQNSLGLMYEKGRGVPQNDTEAVRWYQKAAEQGDKLAQDELRKRGLTWTVRTPEQEAPRAESPAPPPSRPAAKKQAPTPTRSSKIPDDLGDLD